MFSSFKKEFSDENQVEVKRFEVVGSLIEIYFIDCLIDKQIFADAVLNAITRTKQSAIKQKKATVLNALESNIIAT